MLEIQNLTKVYGNNTAVKDVSFKVNNGEIVGFVGLNGAGKSTTINISAGVLNPTSGDVLIDGYSITKDKKKASLNVGWVPELPIFEQDVKALDYFVYIAGFYGFSKSEAIKMGKEIFEEVGLKGVENRKLNQYSQGMKKRFALATSLISNPKNYLFDEVLNGLDPEGISFFRNLALKFKSEGKAILFSSHILSEIESLADRVVFINKGKIVKEMTINEIRNYEIGNGIRIIFEGNVDQRAIQICSKFGDVNAQGNMIIISKYNGDLLEILQELSKAGYKVTDIGKIHTSLEELFFRIIGLSNNNPDYTPTFI
ncbi:ATP-binding cassette domain-containing protein [Acidianus sulfidivorans JP7]|uniref:ABC transporter ATP-binding protein n=1 Tax=Acidianus sulfidivorans JP7 TaxID=619593 RepID=A0A2U9ILF3_9CREN|nr:ABC transporter ATP-binding protein [Acidianus sulfidivorans]AWR96754.1 ATP-binding cassette domain-containing protein [Acidianus sulfidivorans JP7]